MESITLLDGNAAETENLAAALINRSFCYLNVGHVRRARADLVWCQRVAAEGGHDPVVAKAQHNLGYCDLLAGDIPAALQLFSEAASTYQRARRAQLSAGPGHGPRGPAPCYSSRPASPATPGGNWIARLPRSGSNGLIMLRRSGAAPIADRAGRR